MKSERRHELQTNYLAGQLGTAVETSKPYATWIFVGVIAAMVLGVGYGIYAAQTARANSLAWGDYYFNIGSGDSDVLKQLAIDHPGSAAASWAMQAWADHQLLIGMDLLYNNRKDAEESIQKAIGAYETILKSPYEPELKDRAAIGLAQAYESIGKLDQATGYYQQVASGNMQGFNTMAGQRLAWVKSDGKSFYDWLASVRSQPDAPPKLPGNLTIPPKSPGDLSFPQKQNPLVLPEAGQTAPVIDLQGNDPKPADSAVDPAKPVDPAVPIDDSTKKGTIVLPDPAPEAPTQPAKPSAIPPQ